MTSLTNSRRRGALLLPLLVLLAACTTPASPAPAGGESEPVQALQGKDPDEAAAKSLEAYRGLVGQEDFGALGFSSLEEVARAELGRSYRVSLVPLDQLRTYTADADPEKLFVDAGRVIYEVRVGDAVRSSLEVGPIGDVWQGQSFGSPGLIRPIAEFSQADDDFVVTVAALNVYFLAARNSDGLFLTPLFDYEAFGFAAGRPVPAAEGLAALVEAAKGHDELPN
jgi:hypothetical protein